MTCELRVEVRAPSENGRLWPRYVVDSGILVLESRVLRPWPYGVNVDNVVICDLDADRVLANVDIQAKRRVWRRVSPFPEGPTAAERGDLALSVGTIKHRFFHPPVDVRSNYDRSRVLVWFSSRRKASRAIELSPRCFALLHDDCLLGFYVTLPRARGK